jgi:uncharacterized protein (TIGR03000 family)
MPIAASLEQYASVLRKLHRDAEADEPARRAAVIRARLNDVAASDVLINVRVPADAAVWVNGDRTAQSGARRAFLSSDLTPGKNYTYVLKAQWNDGDRTVTATRRVRVHGGEWHDVDLTTPE